MGWFEKALLENEGGGAMSSAFGAIDEVFNPAAARAREELDANHELVQPAPSPGDRLLEHNSITIRKA